MTSPLTVMGAACTTWVAGDNALTIGGTPLARGTLPPAVTWSTNLSRTDVPYITCTSSGTQAVALFAWSVDGGNTFLGAGLSAAATVTAMTAAGAPIPTFPVGTYTAGNSWSPRVKTWPDGAATPHDFSQNTDGSQPELLYNASGAIRGLRGVASNLSSTLTVPGTATNLTFAWIIVRFDGWTNGRALCSSSVAENAVGAIAQGPSPSPLISVPGQQIIGPLNNFYLLKVYWSGNALTDFMQVGGSRSTATSGTITTGMTGTLQLFSRTVGANPISATLCEFALFNRAPTAGEDASLNTYATGRYGSAAVLAINSSLNFVPTTNVQSPRNGRGFSIAGVTQSQLASAIKSIGLIRAAVATQSPSLTRRYARTFAGAQVQLAAALKSRFASLSAAQTQLASALKTVPRVAAAAQAQAATTVAKLDLTRAVSAVQSQTAAAARQIATNAYAAVQAQFASVSRGVGVVQSAVQSQTAAIGRGIASTILAAQSQEPVIRRAISATIQFAQTQLASALTLKTRVYSADNAQSPSVARSLGRLGAAYTDLKVLVRPLMIAAVAAPRALITDLRVLVRPLITFAKGSIK